MAESLETAPTPGPVVILIEDAPEIRRFLRASLIGHGYRLVEAETGWEGLQAAETRQPDLIILDLGLPDLDGLEVIRRLREWTAVPIVVLSARGQEADKVAALDAGADDYLTKPFGAGELLARIQVALRHATHAHLPQEPVISAGDLRLNIALRQVTRAEQEIHLTPTEYEILKTLATHAGKVLTHTLLLQKVWGSGQQQDIAKLRVFMNQLRRKIEDDPAQPRYIVTEPGVGYRFCGDADV
jgi:two-component system KDP operon response regulator KdpE